MPRGPEKTRSGLVQDGRAMELELHQLDRVTRRCGRSARRERRLLASLSEVGQQAVGDANRSAHVERFFSHIEGNFLAGRSFADWETLNGEARVWCDRDNARVRRHLHASPRELFATERLQLRRLPLHVPEVYRIHQRVVDTEGYVNVWRNRYSVPCCR
jgi:hypothetical protein